MALTKVDINAGTTSNLSGSRSLPLIATRISGSFTAPSSSFSTRVARLETSGSITYSSASFSTRVSNLKTDSGSFSTRVSNLKSDSGSFSSRTSTLEGTGTAQGVGTTNSPTFVNVTATGTVTAQEFHTEFVSASIVYISGSTKFGDTIDDIHSFTGSIHQSGSFNLNDGNLVVADNIDLEGDIDVNGTANLDIVDIDGAVDMASTLTIGGNIDFNSGTIDLSTQTVDVTLNAAVDALNFDSNTLSIDATNNRVGIGTASPGRLFSVHEASTHSHIWVSTGGTNASAQLTLESTGTGNSYLAFGEDSISTDLHFYNYKSGTGTAMVIDGATNNVGIGITAPTNPLEIAIGAADESLKLSCFSTTDGHAPALMLVKSSNATIGTLAVTAAGETLGTISANGVNSSGNLKSAAIIKFQGDAGPDADSVPGRILFMTSDLDDVGSPTERMRIDDAGNVGIGLAAPTQLFHVEGASANDWVSRIKTTTSTSGQSYGLQVIAGTNGSDIAFVVKNQANNATMFEVQGDGKVGIGTTAPTSPLHVVSSSASRIVRFQNLGDHADYGGINVSAGTNNQSGTTVFFEADDGDGQSVGTLVNISGTFQLTDTSDSRLKDNIRDTAITGSDIINSIKVRDFEWKKSGIGVTAGLVAQELTSSFAQAVSSGSADKVLGYSVLGISKERLVPVLVKALQESMTRIQTLETQMAQVSGSS